MLFATELKPFDLLAHPFYQAWQAGTLTRETLQCYAQQYLHHVNVFPTYVSRIHSQCADLKSRQVLLKNLMEEEGIDGTAHPILWENFAKGLGVEELHAIPFANTQTLIETYQQLTAKSYAAGLGALYAYERQIPAIAATKIKGLKDFYAINETKTLEFFEVHKSADEWHSQEIEQLIQDFPIDQQNEAKAGAIEAANALWNFLSGMQQSGTCNMKGAECNH